MTLWNLIVQSVRHHARSHLGVVLGSAIGAAVLIGALAVGDSVRHSLREMALARLGKTRLALSTGDRLFRAELAKSLETPLDATVAALLQLPATASRDDGSARANQVQVLGVDPQFWALANEGQPAALPASGEVWLNERLARQLQTRAGDTILLRVSKPSQLSRDAPISAQEETTTALRARVAGILADQQLGRFSLQASQVAPFNAIVDRAWLQTSLKVGPRANLILTGQSTLTSLANANAGLQRLWTLEDGELELRPAQSNRPPEFRTSRVFIDPPVAGIALKSAPSTHGILTYFVNEIRKGTQATPYSMVTATDAPWATEGLKPGETAVTRWLADDLGLKEGDTVILAYYAVGAMRQLIQQSNSFTVRRILPESGPHQDPSLMPDFPGLAQADNCRDWDAGFPIDFERIRDKDNKYWEQQRGTPKAFIPLADGQGMWSNRFGNLTAIRFAGTNSDTGEIRSALQKAIEPSTLGLRFEDVRASAEAAVAGGQDFGQLFIGFSFFLVLSAMILTSLLFQFGVEQRASEIGLLLALGWAPKKVRRLLILEGGLLALIGSILGVIGGVFYAKAMLWGLANLWVDAVGTSSLQYHASASTLVTGVLIGCFTAWFTLILAVRHQARQSARELLTASISNENTGAGSPASDVTANPTRPARNTSTWIVHGGRAAGIALAMLGATKPALAPGCFFGAGALFLISGMASLARLLRKLDSRTGSLADVTTLAIRNLARRPKRSLAVAGLLACGSFMIIAVSANRLEAGKDATKRSSGTGGFALIGESALPVVHDLNAADGREFHNLDPKILGETRFIPLRVRDGEEASCLNLNRAQQPRIVAVQPAQLDRLGAFTFARLLDSSKKSNPWMSLVPDASKPDEIPAIGDAASIQWALGKSLGDTLDYIDERGKPFKIRLVGAVSGSILQGQLVIDEQAFLSRFPSQTGYRMFLIDAPSERLNDVRSHLSRALQDAGLELTPTVERLAAFNAVQNTYLNTFQVLGGLGLLLGSFGVGIVVLRTVLERRSELALLRATGWPARLLQGLILREHSTLFLLGMVSGVASAAVAVLPVLATPGSSLPLQSLGLTLGAILVNGLLWVAVATWGGTRGELLAPLRQNQ